MTPSRRIKRLLPYQEGTWFAVPLRDSGYGVGMAARMHRGQLLGYFFGPHYDAVPMLAEVMHSAPADAILVRRCGDGGLTEGTWPILGHNPQWNRAYWPTPMFGHKDLLIEERYTRREYDDKFHFLGETRITVDEYAQLSRDVLSGHLALEGTLTRVIADPSWRLPDPQPRKWFLPNP